MNLLLAISNAIATDANLTAIAARIKTIMTSVVSPVLVVIGAAGVIYAIILGINYIKAETPDKRKEAQGRLIGAIVGVIIIIAGIVINAFIGKSLTTSMAKAGGKKGGFGPIMNGCFMLALMGVMLPFQAFNGLAYIMVMVTSALITLLIGIIMQKTGWKWLGEFSMAFTLILGMASALLWTAIF